MHRSFPKKTRLAAMIMVALFSLGTGAHAQISTITSRLLGRIDSRRIAEGAPFFVKTISLWKESRCSVPMGATLEGRIAKVVKRGPGVKREEIDLRFLRIPCPGDDSQEITPILVAMHGPKRSSEEDALARQEIMSAFASLAGVHTPSPAGRSGPAPVGALAGKTGTV